MDVVDLRRPCQFPRIEIDLPPADPPDLFRLHEQTPALCQSLLGPLALGDVAVEDHDCRLAAILDKGSTDQNVDISTAARAVDALKCAAYAGPQQFGYLFFAASNVFFEILETGVDEVLSRNIVQLAGGRICLKDALIAGFDDQNRDNRTLEQNTIFPLGVPQLILGSVACALGQITARDEKYGRRGHNQVHPPAIWGRCADSQQHDEHQSRSCEQIQSQPQPDRPLRRVNLIIETIIPIGCEDGDRQQRGRPHNDNDRLIGGGEDYLQRCDDGERSANPQVKAPRPHIRFSGRANQQPDRNQEIAHQFGSSELSPALARMQVRQVDKAKIYQRNGDGHLGEIENGEPFPVAVDPLPTRERRPATREERRCTNQQTRAPKATLLRRNGSPRRNRENPPGQAVPDMPRSIPRVLW